jgi:hypothetical protein
VLSNDCYCSITDALLLQELDKLLPEGATLASHILPQVHTIVQHCFDAARDMLEVSAGAAIATRLCMRAQCSQMCV